MCDRNISKKRTVLLICIDSKAMTKQRQLWLDRDKATYPLKLRVS